MEKVIGFPASNFMFTAEFFFRGPSVPDNHCGTSA